jgi:hypothetical protein
MADLEQAVASLHLEQELETPLQAIQSPNEGESSNSAFDKHKAIVIFNTTIVKFSGEHNPNSARALKLQFDDWKDEVINMRDRYL